MREVLNQFRCVAPAVVMGMAATGAAGQCDPAELFGPQQQFAAGSNPLAVAIADIDGDGELTIFDFLAFQNAFDAGC